MIGVIKYFLLLTVLITLNGCTVGRYVTDVSLSGGNSLAVEKCTTKKWDAFFWNTECKSTEVPLVFEKNSKASENTQNEDDKITPTAPKLTNLVNGSW